jgi:hypothetical protein
MHRVSTKEANNLVASAGMPATSKYRPHFGQIARCAEYAVRQLQMNICWRNCLENKASPAFRAHP